MDEKALSEPEICTKLVTAAILPAGMGPSLAGPRRGDVHPREMIDAGRWPAAVM
jgi:hypothetical protein